MMTSGNATIEKIGLRWGLITLFMLGAYFIMMKILGLIHVQELRALNALLMFYGVFQAIKSTKRDLGEFNYFKGMAAGVMTAFTATFIYATFGVLYLTFVNPAFLAEIQANEPLGMYMNEYSASLQIFIEGSASGVLFSYASLQWLREPHLVGGR